jgi:hypothetical protein
MKDTPLLYVPVKLHVKQYFEKEFGGVKFQHQNQLITPVKMHSNTLLGMLVLLCTEKMPFRFTPQRKADRDHMLALQLPARSKDLVLSETLTKLLEKIFNDKLYDFIRSQSVITGSEWAAMRCFAAIYELDSLSFDPDKFYKLWRDKKNSIAYDNRGAIEDWYRTNRVQPDGDQAWTVEPQQNTAA